MSTIDADRLYHMVKEILIVYAQNQEKQLAEIIRLLNVLALRDNPAVVVNLSGLGEKK